MALGHSCRSHKSIQSKVAGDNPSVVSLLPLPSVVGSQPSGCPKNRQHSARGDQAHLPQANHCALQLRQKHQLRMLMYQKLSVSPWSSWRQSGSQSMNHQILPSMLLMVSLLPCKTTDLSKISEFSKRTPCLVNGEFYHAFCPFVFSKTAAPWTAMAPLAPPNRWHPRSQPPWLRAPWVSTRRGDGVQSVQGNPGSQYYIYMCVYVYVYVYVYRYRYRYRYR